MKSWCAGIVLMVAAVPAAANVVVRDSFTIGDGTGVANAQLHGVNTEVGGATWQANGNLSFGADGTVRDASPDTTAAFNAFVSYVPGANQLVTLQADLHPVGDNADNEWIAIGFGNSTANPATGFPSHLDLTVLLTEAGNVSVFANNFTALLGTGPAANYNSSGFNFVELDYHTGLHTVAVRVNNVALPLTTSDLDAISFTPVIANAGFALLRQSPAAALDNFAVPEPSVGAATLLTALLCMSRRARRA